MNEQTVCVRFACASGLPSPLETRIAEALVPWLVSSGLCTAGEVVASWRNQTRSASVISDAAHDAEITLLSEANGVGPTIAVRRKDVVYAVRLALPPREHREEGAADEEHPSEETSQTKEHPDDRSTEKLNIVDPVDLWTAYFAAPGDNTRNALVVHYLPVVRYAVDRLMLTLPQSVNPDDLISVGVFGLMEAIAKFDPERGVKFRSFASWRVRGSILDELRESDWVPRLVRTKETGIDAAEQALRARLGREPTWHELAAELGVPPEEWENWSQDAVPVTVLSLTGESNAPTDGVIQGTRTGNFAGLTTDHSSPDPAETMQKLDVMEVITNELGLRERMIFILYYFEDLTMFEIANTLDLSESRVCQIHGRVLARLQKTFAGRYDDLRVEAPWQPMQKFPKPHERRKRRNRRR